MLGPLVSALALAQAKQSAERAVRSLVLGVAMAVVGLAAAGFLVAAIVIALSRAVGPIWACLIVAVVFGLIAGVLQMVRSSIRRQRSTGPGALAMLGGLGAGAAAGSRAGEAAADDALPFRRRTAGRSPFLTRKALLVPAAAFLAALFVARR
ncbi:phage holin family protein [Chthonobacter rhizosphaerae]|uniref:phage holin family protein n=1 Tax=Chthonobacter rhizosphaerae TaxID=2735553 RepID=UPI0015EED825|nr:phage holin family protein [Chthonobacter rhizosphaerae]